MNWLYALAQPFVGHPLRIFLVAGGLLALALLLSRRARRPVLSAAIAWTIFGVLEVEAGREHADIRVDLLFTWPVVCLTTIVCLAVALKARRAPDDAGRGEAA